MMEQDLDLVNLTPELMLFPSPMAQAEQRDSGLDTNQSKMDCLAPCPDSAQTSQEGQGQGKPSQSWPSGTPQGRDQVVANQVLGLLSQ